MADNTRKTSNIIHDVAKVKEDVSNNTQNIKNNTDAIGNISIPSVGDGGINLEAGNGLTLASGNENAKANQDSNTTFKIEADLAYLNDNLNIPVGDGQINLEASDGLTLVAGSANATANQSGNTTFKVKADLEWLSGNLNIPTGGVSKIVAGENVTISPTNGTGEVTINAAGGTSTGGIGEAPNDGTQYGRKDKSWTPITHVVPGDGNITLSNGTGINVSGTDATANQTGDTGWSISVNDDVALKSDIPEIPVIPAPVVPGDGNITLKSTDSSVSITGQNATANQTSNTAWDLSVNIPTPATPGDGKIDLSGGTGIDITGANATANQSGNTAWSVAIDSTVALKSDIPVIPAPVVPGDGTMKLSGGTGIDVTGANGTANQTGNSSQTISIDSTVALKSDIPDIPVIPPAVVPGDGNITLTEGDGITVSGADATANQTGDTAWTVKTDNDYLNKTLNFAKPGDIPVVPTELGVMTIQNVTPHDGGDFDFKSSDDALVVNITAHGLSLSIDENELDFVKEIKSGNELTLTVDDDGNGTVTLTAAGGSGGGAGNIAFAGGKCIAVDPETVGDLTTYTINNDLDCLNTSLGFATDQDITNAIGDIEIPEKTSALTNDGENGTDPFITAADIPAAAKATLPIATEDGSIVLGQAIQGQYDFLSVVEGTQFVIVINEATKLKLTEAGSLSVYGTSSTTFFNKSEDLACFAKFESSRASCFIGTESYSPFVVKDKTGADTLISVNSVGVFAAAGDIKTNDGRFRGQAYTTNSAEDGDPEIKMSAAPQQIEMDAAGKLCVVVNEKYVQSFVDIQTVGIAGRNDPTTDARIDLGADFKVSKGDGTERFSINVQSGAIKQTTSAYTAFVIDGSNATGALIRTSCGGGTYNFGATNLGWLVMDNAFNPLLIVSDTDIKAQNNYVPQGPSSLVTRKFFEENGASGELPISSGDSSVTLDSPAADEFEISLAGEMKLRITENDIQASPGYQPRSDTSLVTKRFLYANSNDTTPIVPPGQGSGDTWQEVNTGRTINSYTACVACDGVFTYGNRWSVDGVNWNSVPYEALNNSIAIYNDGFENIASSYFGMYHAGNAYSYNMKNWAGFTPQGPIGNTYTAGPVYFWNEFFYATTSGTPGGSQGRDPDYGGRVPEIRSLSSGLEPAGADRQNIMWDYAESQWSVPNRQHEIWNWTQLASDGDTFRTNYFPFVVSNPNGNQALAVQRPMRTDGNQTKSTPSVVYLKTNEDQDFESSDNYFQAQWTPIPSLGNNFDASGVKGIACNFSTNTWVFILSDTVFYCTGNPATAAWRSTSIPPGNWAKGFHFNGEKFVAVTEGENSNFAIYSADGVTWASTTNISTKDDGILCGTNGRSLLSDENIYAELTGSPSQGLNTANVDLTNPANITRRDDASPYALLTTQEDANGYFAEKIADNAGTANNASQDASAALSKATLNSKSIDGMSEAIEKNIEDIAKKAEIRVLTQAQYDALTSYDPKTLYCISD